MTEKVVEAWGVFSANNLSSDTLVKTPGHVVTGPLFCIYENRDDAVEDFGGFSTYAVRPVKIVIPDQQQERGAQQND